MSYDGAGNYTRTHNFSADASANIKILAARVDAEFDDFASAMGLPLLRDGRNAATANIPMGGFRHTNVGAPSSATNYIRAKDFIENVPIYMVDAETSADRISVSAAFYTTASAATAPRDGSHILVKAGSDKSSAVAIRLNTGDGSPHSAAVILANGSALYSGAIRSGGIYEFFWSSSDTAWQLGNPQVDYASSAYPGVVLLATAAEVAAGTNVAKAVTPSQLADKFSADYATTASAGLVELATTAEVQARTNVSAVVTPAALAAFSASTTYAGLLEIATTAEVASASSEVAITARLSRLLQPYLMALTINSVSAAPSITANNIKASAWTFTSAGPGAWSVGHNLGLASAGELLVNLQVASIPDTNICIVITTAQASGFRFGMFDTSAGLLVTPSVAIHLMAHRLF